ncbi:MFS transporter [Nocardia sp. 2]|uniref:MFS transporter n=1 Tax=Nocardia acididurans TaxID=2802282 RepID=A0ABS1MD38_9NOCA|nr:MFS transporter [Nocardia acididurans]MBL1077995.1 MFS transporter [Nocardia acididurans]
MTTSISAPPAPERAGARAWAAVLSVTLGIFTLVTAEMLPIGLLSPMSSALGVSEGTVGLLVTVPGVVAAVSAPLVTVLAGTVDRKLLLCLLIGAVSLATLATALTSAFAVAVLARVVFGIGMGGFWALAGGLAPRLVPEPQVGKATAWIFSGVAAASVLGVPAATFIGDVSSWRTACLAVAGLGFVVLAALALYLPGLPAHHAVRPRELGVLVRRNRGVAAGLVLILLLVTGHFTAYTFVRPILEDLHGVGAGALSALLFGYGVAGITGNFLAGNRDPRRSLLAITLALAVVTAALALTGGPVIAVALMLIWGLAYGGVSVSIQKVLLGAAPESPEAVTSVFVAVFNLAIAAGALIGGRAVDLISLPATLWIACAATALAVVVVLTSGRRERPQPARRR